MKFINYIKYIMLSIYLTLIFKFFKLSNIFVFNKNKPNKIYSLKS